MDGSHGDNGDYDTNYHLLSITANSKKTEEYLYLKFSKYYMSSWFLSFVCLFGWVFFFFLMFYTFLRAGSYTLRTPFSLPVELLTYKGCE